MVRIRMSRLGRTHRPFYRINAVEKKTQRDGRVLENLGWYDPMAAEDKQVSLKEDRIKHWIGVGAQPSDTCNDLFAAQGIIDADAWKAVRQSRVTRKMKAVEEARLAKEAADKAEAAAKAEAEAKAAADAEAANADAADETAADGEASES